jgi:acyl carrier protein
VRRRAVWRLKDEPEEKSSLSQEVSSWVVDWFTSRGKLRSSGLEMLEVDYLASGLLTSLEIVELVGELEDHFGFQFSDADMQDPRFSTIGGIAQLVVTALNQASKVG